MANLYLIYAVLFLESQTHLDLELHKGRIHYGCLYSGTRKNAPNFDVHRPLGYPPYHSANNDNNNKAPTRPDLQG